MTSDPNRSIWRWVLALTLLVGIGTYTFSRTPDDEPPDPCIGTAHPLICRYDSSMGPSNPCRFIPVAEAAKIFGSRIGLPGHRVSEPVCYNTTGSGPGAYKFSYESDAGAEQAFDAVARDVRDTVEDIGLDARWERATRTLHVRTGSGYLWVEIQHERGPRRLATILARIAMQRIENEEAA